MPVIFLEFPWRATLRMTGRDRARFLHGMCTNDIKKLGVAQSCLAAIVNRQGKMVAEMTVAAAPDALFIVLDRSNLQTTIDTLSRFLVADDVRMESGTHAVVGVYGGSPPAGLPSAADPSLPFEGHLVLVPEPGRAELLQALAASGASRIAESDYESLRIENGFPRWGADMGPDVLPMEAGLEPIAISYTKGCYIGQEVIQRVKTYSEPPRMLVQLKVASASPGDTIVGGTEEIGKVTSAIASVALGYVRKEFKQPGTKVTIAGREAIVQALPWHEKLT